MISPGERELRERYKNTTLTSYEYKTIGHLTKNKVVIREGGVFGFWNAIEEMQIRRDWHYADESRDARLRKKNDPKKD